MGLPGSNGQRGEMGDKGATGIQGQPGVSGEKGATVSSYYKFISDLSLLIISSLGRCRYEGYARRTRNSRTSCT